MRNYFACGSCYSGKLKKLFTVSRIHAKIRVKIYGLTRALSSITNRSCVDFITPFILSNICPSMSHLYVELVSGTRPRARVSDPQVRNLMGSIEIGRKVQSTSAYSSRSAKVPEPEKAPIVWGSFPLIFRNIHVDTCAKADVRT